MMCELLAVTARSLPSGDALTTVFYPLLSSHPQQVSLLLGLPFTVAMVTDQNFAQSVSTNRETTSQLSVLAALPEGCVQLCAHCSTCIGFCMSDVAAPQLRLLLVYLDSPRKAAHALRSFVQTPIGDHVPILAAFVDMHQRWFDSLLPCLLETHQSALSFLEAAFGTSESFVANVRIATNRLHYYTNLFSGHPLEHMIASYSDDTVPFDEGMTTQQNGERRTSGSRCRIVRDFLWNQFRLRGRHDIENDILRLIVEPHRPSVFVWERPRLSAAEPLGRGGSSGMRVVLVQSSLVATLSAVGLPQTAPDWGALISPHDEVALKEEVKQTAVLRATGRQHQWMGQSSFHGLSAERYTVIPNCGADSPNHRCRGDLIMSLLQESLRRQWRTVICSVLDGHTSKEDNDALMDRIYCWGYEFPRTIIFVHAVKDAFQSIQGDFLEMPSLAAAIAR